MEYIGIKKKQGSIVERLKDEILSGRIPGGTEMTQNELADSLGVSRMPVREALIILEYQGLIERLPNNHVRVTALSDDYFSRIFELCAGMEHEMLKRRPELVAFCVKEKDFHRQLCVNFPGGLLKKTLETLIDTYAAYALDTASYDPQRGREMIGEAAAAYREGESERGKELLCRYFETLAEAIREERMG